MKNKKDNNSNEQSTDVKGTIVGFVAPEIEEKTQEQEIQDFKLKKQSEKELAMLSEAEQKKKREQYKKEEERLEKVKVELLKSIRERIPAIEKKFNQVLATTKKGKVVEKVNGKMRKKTPELEQNLQKTQNQEEKERE